jgi:hypothetical protein
MGERVYGNCKPEIYVKKKKYPENLYIKPKKKKDQP